jgi:predicted nucleic acid-binding protein
MSDREIPRRPATLFLDTNVLYSAGCRDLLIEASLAGLCHCRWSKEVLVELDRAFRRSRPDLKPAQLSSLMAALASACPEALQEQRPAKTPALPSMVDPADAHVLRGAIRAQADVILTFNLKHFPRRLLAHHGLIAMTPDQWLVSLAKSAPSDIMAIAERCRSRLVRPPLTRAHYLASLRRSGLSLLTDFLSRHDDTRQG